MKQFLQFLQMFRWPALLLASAAAFPVPEAGSAPAAELPDPPASHRSEDTDECAEDLMAAAASAFSRTNFE